MSEDSSVLSEKEAYRYSRQLMMDGFGLEAQSKLKSSRVAVVGLGGLGSPVATYLTLAGLGRLVLIDPDPVDETNLNRQYLHWEKDIGRPKVCSASEKLCLMNGMTRVEVHQESVSSGNVDRLLNDVDVVVDCLDNWEARFVLNDHCVRGRKPLVHAAVEGWNGQVTVIVPGLTPCLRCLMERPPRKQGQIAIIGANPGVIGSIEAVEVIKLITGQGDPLLSRMLLVDLASMELEVLALERKRGCSACGAL